jgi:hypothetical protein
LGWVMRLLQIRARTGDDADCLVRELAGYSPMRSGKSILVEIQESSQSTLMAVLAAVETCLIANQISGVRVELDGRVYALAPR